MWFDVLGLTVSIRDIFSMVAKALQCICACFFFLDRAMVNMICSLFATEILVLFPFFEDGGTMSKSDLRYIAWLVVAASTILCRKNSFTAPYCGFNTKSTFLSI